MKFKLYKISIIILMISFLLNPDFSIAEKYKLSRFVSPEICGDCHSDIYNQWENSMHNLSQKDPIYLKLSEFILKGLTEKDEIAEAESCVKCHVPIGVVTGYPKKLSDDKSKIPHIAEEGIQCDYCHSAIGAEKKYNNDLKLDPGYGEDDPGIKRGPYNDSESDYHETGFSEFHTNSKICGTCHNVKHVVFNTDLETTYEEWEKGPYNSDNPKNRITCQGCHMYQKPGIPSTGSTKRPENKGYASDDGPVRDHVFTHYFTGASSYVHEKFGDKTKASMAEERLKNAASVSINTEQIKKGKLFITITNIGAGHFLPTGVTDIRQMWLNVTISNDKQKTFYTSGKPDLNGYLPDGTIIYNTVFGDGNGKPVVKIAKAREILKDKRIPPLGSVIETLATPIFKSEKLTINVKLLYRTAPQKLLDLVSGKDKIKLPIITMAEIEEKI
ncbi:MAG: cytochrome c554 family protein [Desulfobacteraceae bacterium]|jgi:hypothetical protein|nr:cytochrome c554 family protein [Desulfobacteraceae bacterium]